MWIAEVPDYHQEFRALNDMSTELADQTDIIDSVDSWTVDFDRYTQKYFGIKAWKLDKEGFDQKLGQYLFSPKGGKFRKSFRFDSEPSCGNPSPKLLLSEISFVHRIFDGPEEHVPAMRRVKTIIQKANVTGRVFPLSIGQVSHKHLLFLNWSLGGAEKYL